MNDFDANAFFARYGMAITALSVDAIVAHYDLPVFMAVADQRVTVTDPVDFRTRVADLVARYREAGLAIAKSDVVDTVKVEGRFVTAQVAWSTMTGDGDPLWSFAVAYVVDLGRDDPRIVAVFNPSGR